MDKKTCYICTGQIEEGFASFVGKDKNGKELYRHRKCNPKGNNHNVR